MNQSIGLEREMLKIGDKKRGDQIGKVHYAWYIWVTCSDCGKERWVSTIKARRQSGLCRSCANKGTRSANYGRSRRGNLSSRWKGGRYKTSTGYIRVWVPEKDFFYPMAHTRHAHVLEHRLVVAKALGRCLHPWEVVHHKNHIKDDNRLGNLQLVSDGRHRAITILEVKISHLEKRIVLLKQENSLLKVAIEQANREAAKIIKRAEKKR